MFFWKFKEEKISQVLYLFFSKKLKPGEKLSFLNISFFPLQFPYFFPKMKKYTVILTSFLFLSACGTEDIGTTNEDPVSAATEQKLSLEEEIDTTETNTANEEITTNSLETLPSEENISISADDFEIIDKTTENSEINTEEPPAQTPTSAPPAPNSPPRP